MCSLIRSLFVCNGRTINAGLFPRGKRAATVRTALPSLFFFSFRFPFFLCAVGFRVSMIPPTVRPTLTTVQSIVFGFFSVPANMPKLHAAIIMTT